MAVTVTIREVNQHTSAVFERVRSGEEVIVTRLGQPAARISPYVPGVGYEQLVAQGKIIPARRKDAPRPTPLRGPMDLDALLDRERAEADWL